MLPESLLKFLRCLECSEFSLKYEGQEGFLLCPNCGAHFPVQKGIPSMLTGGPEKQDWNPWDLDKVKMMGDSYYKRSKGELPEKESSKSYAKLLERREIIKPGDPILDIGCATGHFYRSFRRILSPDFFYTGIDSSSQYLQWGREAYGLSPKCNFVHCDALDMPFQNASYDLVIVNLFHFFPRIDNALREAMRVAKRMVIWRTPVGVVNYIVKVIYEQSFDKIGVLSPERNDFDHSLYMLYSKEYIEGLVPSLGGKIAFIEKDTDFGEFDNTALDEFKDIPASKVIDGKQINGNLILDWHYVGIKPGN